jgi:hypothetical protein
VVPAEDERVAGLKDRKKLNTENQQGYGASLLMFFLQKLNIFLLQKPTDSYRNVARLK